MANVAVVVVVHTPRRRPRHPQVSTEITLAQLREFEEYHYPMRPEGWSGPFKMTYLRGLVKDQETGRNVRIIPTFSEAVIKANQILECSGIVKTKTGYSLRKGTTIFDSPDNSRGSGLACWSKTQDPANEWLRSKGLNF
jgi:hypothetical protein